jgi:hypothetical protein
MRWVRHVTVAKHLMGNDHLGKPRLRCEDNIKYIVKKSGVMVVSVLKWLRIGYTGGLVNRRVT